MELALIVLGGLSLLELILTLPSAWRLHRQTAAITLAGLAVGMGRLIAASQAAWVWLLLVLSAYRVINLLRFVQNRSQPDYLCRSGRRASLWLLGFQALTLLAALLQHAAHFRAAVYCYTCVIAGLALTLVLLTSTMRHLRTTRPPRIVQQSASRDLPGLTVAIPARNETADLEACLQSLLLSNYPKLEILVLDDCSQNKRTPEIIRGFAHDGVRFIAGIAPPQHWLPKNYAYHQLAAEANGELLLFCGVDARFARDSLRTLVETLLYKKKTMLSILPKNLKPAHRTIGSLLVQPGRYAWEMALPRRLLERPPVLSTCWLITAEALRRAGGFAAVTRSSLPESYFAKHAARHGDGYSFLVAGAAIGTTSVKSYPEQLATAVRTRYPALHRRPELVALVSIVELALLFGPFVIGIAAIASGRWPLAVLAVVDWLLLIVVQTTITRLTYRSFLWRGVFLTPIAPLFDSCLLNYSMWQYEFGEVIWKDRNVCVPVMQVIPALPKS